MTGMDDVSLPITVGQAAERWDLSTRRVLALLAVPGLVKARKVGGVWLIDQLDRPAPRRPGRHADPKHKRQD